MSFELLNRKHEGGSAYILLQNVKGSLLQRHPNENECITENYRNLAIIAKRQKKL